MNKQFAITLGNTIKESLTIYESKTDSNTLISLCFYHDPDDNSLMIYDQTNLFLNKIQLPGDHFFNLIPTLRNVLYHLKRERLFDRNFIEKPFTVSLVDKDFIVLEELLFVDDDTVRMNNISWSYIEKDLDNFIEHLLK